MKIIGSPQDRTPAGARCELRVIVDDVCVLLITGEAVIDMQTHENPLGIPFFECELRCEGEVGYLETIHEGTHIELWAELPQIPLHRFFVGRVDFVKYSQQLSRETMRLEGRGLPSRMFDESHKQSFSGNLSVLLSELCAAHGVEAQCDLSETQLNMFIDADSAYGVLRLIGASLNFIVSHLPDGKLRFVSPSEALKEKLSKKPFIITEDDIKSFGRTEGRPVKRPSK
jgi:hypothetical protein